MRLTLRREEWAALAREVRERYRESAPAGLLARIDDLLRETPAGWADQECALELDPASAEVVTAVMDAMRGDPMESAQPTQEAQTLAEADAVLRAHQHRRDGSAYRIEHRTGGTSRIIGWTSDAYARQEELSQHAARLMSAGATGEVVLVEEATGTEVARRMLHPET